MISPITHNRKRSTIQQLPKTKNCFSGDLRLFYHDSIRICLLDLSRVWCILKETISVCQSRKLLLTVWYHSYKGGNIAERFELHRLLTRWQHYICVNVTQYVIFCYKLLNIFRNNVCEKPILIHPTILRYLYTISGWHRRYLTWYKQTLMHRQSQ